MRSFCSHSNVKIIPLIFFTIRFFQKSTTLFVDIFDDSSDVVFICYFNHVFHAYKTFNLADFATLTL